MYATHEGTAADVAALLAELFQKFGEVHEVRPYVWAGTSLVTPSWLILVAKSKDGVVPSVIPLGTDVKPLIIERTGHRTVCRYCLSVEHTKSDCRKRQDLEERRREKGRQ